MTIPSLWDYAVKVYAIDGMQERLLKLQDRYHIDVNTVLWCLWCARFGFHFGATEVHKILSTTTDMSRHTTKPMRAVRLYLSTPRLGFPPARLKELRDQVLQIELFSEELVLKRLDEVTRAEGVPNETLDDMDPRAEQLFLLARREMDMPVMIADEGGPRSPLGLFRRARDLARDEGP